MARGFGGETTEQEARGNEGLSSSDIAGGRQDAATSAAIGGRDVDPGAGGGDNYTANDYIPNMARVNEVLDYRQKQEAFNLANGITDANPFGRLSRGVMGFAINKLGLDPKHVSYPSLSLSQRRAIANNQFSKFMNPQNKPGEIVNNRASDLFTGFNPNFRTAKEGELRSGVQYDGYKTQYGDVMSQAREQSTGEMLARGAFGLLAGLPGLALGQIGTKEYGLPGQPGFEDFDPNNPRPGGGILGQFLGGLNPTQAKDALVGAFAPVAPAPTPTSIGTAPANTTGFEEKRSQHPLTGETTVSPSGPLQGPPQLIDQSTSPLNMDIGLDYPGTEFDRRVQGSFTEIGGTMDDARERALQAAFRAPGEQLAGLFGDDPRAAGFRSLQDNIQSIINNEPLPDNQNMYGPGMQDQAPLTPDELNNILEPYGMELGRGSSTANQYAQVDYSNLSNVGGNLYQPARETNALDSFLEKLGMKERKRKSSGQIYSPSGSSNFFGDMFDNLRN